MLHDFTSQFWSSTADGLAYGAIYALVALGYTMVYGVLRLINFAHSEIFMIGTFGALFVVQQVGLSAPASGLALVGMLVLMALVGMAAAGGSAVLLERIAYRPLRRKGASRLAALITAIGASLFLQELFALVVIPNVFNADGRNTISIERVMDKDELFSIGDAKITSDMVLVVGVAILMMIMLDLLVNKTKIGRGIRATAQDPQTAVLMGVNIDRIVMMTFLIGGAMAGVAGALFMLKFENTRFNIGFLLGIKAFTAAVLGGIGNLRGALVGGFALGLAENYGASIFGSAWIDVVAFTILIIVLMFRPTGILGESLQQARA